MSRTIAVVLTFVLLGASAVVVSYSSRPATIDSSVRSAKQRARQVLNQQRVATLSDNTIPTVSGRRVSDRFPNIDLIDHRGRQLRFYDDLVRDRAVCIVFFYTRCTGSCPGTTATLKRLRKNLKHEFAADELTFISLTLEPDVDTPEELQEYMARYGIQDDNSLPDWVYATGNFEELDRLRRSLGVYDLDPIIDADKTEHAAIMTFGNDRTNRWAALPAEMKTSYLTKALTRIAGNSDRQRYSAAAKLGDVARQNVHVK